MGKEMEMIDPSPSLLLYVGNMGYLASCVAENPCLPYKQVVPHDVQLLRTSVWGWGRT